MQLLSWTWNCGPDKYTQQSKMEEWMDRMDGCMDELVSHVYNICSSVMTFSFKQIKVYIDWDTALV